MTAFNMLRRKRIGVIVDNLYDYQWNILSGIFSAGEYYNIDIYCFTGKTLNSPRDYEKQGNLIYNLVSQENVDGLIIFSSALSSDTTLEEITKFCQNYSFQIPTVSIGLPIEGITSLIVDNESGFRNLLVHLIEDHDYKKFAFITGPLNNMEAQIRYDVFMNTLKKYDIKIPSQNIFYGDFLYNSGREAIKSFLDKEKIKFEVLISSNDDMALGAIEELKERGYMLPEEIKITGFDDIEEASFITPPLTTVKQPLKDIGWKAIEIVLAKISGESFPHIISLPTNLVIRNSCGCTYSAIERAKIDNKKGKMFVLFKNLLSLEEDFINYVENNLGKIDRDILREIYINFIYSLNKKEAKYFLNTLDKNLKLKEKFITFIGIFQEYISLLRRFLFKYLEEDHLQFVEDLYHQARVIISDYSERIQGYRRSRIKEQTNLLANIGISLISSFKIDNILREIKENLPQLGIKSFYIVLFEDKIVPNMAKLLLGYDGKEKETVYFPKEKIIPQQILPKRRVSFVVEPLYYQENYFGYALFELGPQQGIIYEILRAQISASLQGAYLFEEREKYEMELERNINELSILNEIGSSITSSIELNVIFNLISKQISKLFEFSAFYLVLCNGTCGEKFDILVKNIQDEKEKLSKSEKLLILQAIKNKTHILKKNIKGRTKSLLCIPLISGNKSIGVIILKHKEREIFSEKSINLLTTVSNFVSIAIENARLFDETKKLATIDPLTGLLNRRALEEIFNKEIMRIQRYKHPISVIVIDVDDFKLFNDTFGHAFGDQVLKEFSNLLKKSCRKVDFVGRYGGDEFAIILPETSREGAEKLAQRIFNNLKEKSITTPTNEKIPIKISLGIASYPMDTEDPEKLFTIADTTMYKAKTLGGGQYATISSQIPATAKRNETPEFDVFLGLITAIDNKDNYTFVHSQDVAKYAVNIGKKLGLPKEDLEVLDLAGKLHDIGKIGIPSNILRKPGSLEEEEWKIIKEHPKLGYLILNQLPKMEKLLQAILYHHERYDGKGYPQSLKGEEIPILARILAIADAYSAMKSDRPYRKALSKKEIIEEIKNHMGKQF
ncbi:MAG: diguanylate cyclase, partial [Dictyoglomaceae bacterium]|nr:diguanylate cyclase [Dictyoglomaceae bacterium]